MPRCEVPFLEVAEIALLYLKACSYNARPRPQPLTTITAVCSEMYLKARFSRFGYTLSGELQQPLRDAPHLVGVPRLERLDQLPL